MKGSPKEASELGKSGARVWFPRPKATTLVERLAELTRKKHVSTYWVQLEIAKLLPSLRKQEQEKYLYALGGFAVGLGFILLISLGAAL